MLQKSFTLRLRSVGREGNDNKLRYLTKSILFSQPGNHASSVEIKCCHYRPGVAQRVGRGIALLFHDRGTRRRRVVSSTPRSHFTPGKEPVPILQEAGWAPRPVWKGAENLVPTVIRSRTFQPAVSCYTD